MSSLRSLVEEECGTSNALVNFSSHFVRDAAFTEEGLTHPHEIPGTSQMDLDNAEHTFNMQTLLNNLRNIENHEQLGFSGNSQREEQNIPKQNQSAVNLVQNLTDDTRMQMLNNIPMYSQAFYGNAAVPLEEPFLNPPFHAFRNFMQFQNNASPQSLFDELNSINDEYADSSSMQGSAVSENVQLLDKWADDVDESMKPVVSRIVDQLITDSDPSRSKAGPSNAEEDRNMNEEYNSQMWERFKEQLDQMKEDETDHIDFFDDVLFNRFQTYYFVEQNAMLENKDALNEGKRRLANGDWPGAVLCFEAAVQQEENMNNAQAWLLLGKTQAENEQDPQAIAALRNCLRLDSKNLDALMCLAVSYTNENFYYQACYALKEWLKSNRKYASLFRNYKDEEADRSSVTSILKPKYYQSIVDLYNKAISQDLSAGVIDPELHNGMGILLTLNSDQAEAAKYFQNAVREKPDDAQLWNRLGATLANLQNSEAAMDAYQRALKISFGFIRARYNLAIALIHMNRYKEAIEMLLTALSLQASGRGLMGEKSKATSESMWSTLRLALSLGDRQDLLPLVQNRQLDVLNRQFGVAGFS